MTRIASLAALCLSVALVGCQSTKTSPTSAGAVSGDKPACCSSSGGACSDACKDKSSSMGAVSGQDGCSSSCTKTCPVTGETSMGAVGSKDCGSNSGCSKSCPTTGETSMGAVSDDSGKSCCPSSKGSCNKS
ncbi:MAG: hypothetical protein KDA22_12360 [Phycisphaerales bacterium]|nr:hypothetical protein [Phycisphaerales bacterium]